MIAAAFIGSSTFIYKGIRLTVSKVEIVRGDVLSCRVAASDTRGTLPLDNPYEFVNPPVMVTKSGRGLVEDPKIAFQRALGDVVLYVARREGWKPSQL